MQNNPVSMIVKNQLQFTNTILNHILKNNSNIIKNKNHKYLNSKYQLTNIVNIEDIELGQN